MDPNAIVIREYAIEAANLRLQLAAAQVELAQAKEKIAALEAEQEPEAPVNDE